MKPLLPVLTCVALLTSAQAYAAASVSVGSSQSPFFFGGGIGASFGDVSYIEVAPMIGMHLDPRMSVGVSFLYRNRSDKRVTPKRSTDDYGTTLFGRYHLTSNFFLEANYEYLDYEFATGPNTTARKDFSSVLGGGGIRTPIGPNASMYASALYNFSYDRADSPYDDPWTVRFGVGFGF
ncbi:MAG: hypothetical protein ACFCUJ_00920 [Thiotrichales bacterium]